MGFEIGIPGYRPESVNATGIILAAYSHRRSLSVALYAI